MDEIKTIITEQLQQLQILMQRLAFQTYVGGRRSRNPHRGQGRVLAVLTMKPEISQRELNYLLGMSKQSLAELLGKLERSGYITREPSEEDKRVTTIRLTEEGKKAAEDMDDEGSDSTNILDCLSEEELDIFSEYLGRIIKQYEDHFPNENFEERRRTLEAFILRNRPSYDRRSGRRDGRHHSNGRGRGENGERRRNGRGIDQSDDNDTTADTDADADADEGNS